MRQTMSWNGTAVGAADSPNRFFEYTSMWVALPGTAVP